MENSNLISKRLSDCAERLTVIIEGRTSNFILPESKGIKNVFADGSALSHETISQDLRKFLAGLKGQIEAWSTGKYQGQTVQKEQLLSGFTPLLRDWDKLINAWDIYGVSGNGIDNLRKLYDDVVTISNDAQHAPFPN